MQVRLVQVRSWVLATSLSQQDLELVLGERRCARCGAAVYEASLSCCACGATSPACVVSGEWNHPPSFRFPRLYYLAH
jgi:hypothetical protein